MPDTGLTPEELTRYTPFQLGLVICNYCGSAIRIHWGIPLHDKQHEMSDDLTWKRLSYSG
jgi:hypothetical protein